MLIMLGMKSVYLDNAATTPVDPRVLDAMLPYYRRDFGNAASHSHPFGWAAEEAVEKARQQVSRLINAAPKEIIFTSGATESDNLAILGAAAGYARKGRHIITCAIEHKAVIDPCLHLRSQGFDVTFLEPDHHGRICLETVRQALSDDTILVSLMMANNEIGTLNPISEIGTLCHERGILFHTDAAQAFGKVPIDVKAQNIDLMSISGHKIYGPKGIAALFVRAMGPHVRIQPLTYGGGHERGLRSGTLNVPGVVGLGEAARIAEEEMSYEHARINALRDRLWAGLSEQIDEISINGDPEHRLANILNVSFPGVDGECLILAAQTIAVSVGSACMSAQKEPSYVLEHIGVPEEIARCSIRFSLGRFTTQEEIDYTIDKVVATVKQLRRETEIGSARSLSPIPTGQDSLSP